MERPSVGTHYPRSTGEFQAWFRTDADCLDYLDWVRWPGGFTCPSCGHAGGWQLGDGRRECAGCHGRTSVTAGTIFDRTRTPLTVWFTACWLFATQKDGISAQSLQRSLEIGSYPTAWAMLHRLSQYWSHVLAPTTLLEIDSVFLGEGFNGAIFLQVGLVAILDVVIEGEDELLRIVDLLGADRFELAHHGRRVVVSHGVKRADGQRSRRCAAGVAGHR